jgi:flavin-dependent dehydrogenase
MALERYEVLIAGAGPAGMATALYLLARRPDLAGRIAALEKSRHPRPKICAGGLIPKTIAALEELKIDLPVPSVVVTGGSARTEVGSVELPHGEPLCTIVRRDLFDFHLAQSAQRAGLRLIENCRVTDVARGQGMNLLRTDRGDFEAPVIIGADGSGSLVRRKVFSADRSSVGRAVMIDLPVDPAVVPEFREKIYRFDFTCVPSGVSGYSWSFPCLIDGRPHLNVGIYEQFAVRHRSETSGNRLLIDNLRCAFPELDLPVTARCYRAFPIQWYDSRRSFASEGAILVGDAAGVDPLMGEGISYAFEHGRLAAEAADRFLAGDRHALYGYGCALHESAVGRKLRRLAYAARRFYGPHHRRYFRLAMLSRKAISIGVDWYNGAHATDEVPARWLIARWAKAVLLGRFVR